MNNALRGVALIVTIGKALAKISFDADGSFGDDLGHRTGTVTIRAGESFIDNPVKSTSNH